jgi:4,5-dihydroxyphthalate decarboxylase
VRPSDVHWFSGGLEHPGRREMVAFTLPSDVHRERIPEDRTLAPMLDAGEIDALITARMPEPFIRRSPRIRRLFPNYREVEADYYRRVLETFIRYIYDQGIATRQLAVDELFAESTLETFRT